MGSSFSPGSPASLARADILSVPDTAVLWLRSVVRDQPDTADLSGPGDSALLAELTDPHRAHTPPLAGFLRRFVPSPAHSCTPVSILVREKDGRGSSLAVVICCFSDDPDLPAPLRGIRTHEPGASLERRLVELHILGAEIAPVAELVPAKALEDL